ncbi:M48 family metalloprotease [Aquabacterium sp.]|uniref:M48 family metalloprotease n=1 Tax=Aquabacterium sp. TaxID=1872578 RepID=UPI003BF5CA95
MRAPKLKAVVLAALLSLGALQAQALIYDPFVDGAAIKPVDELEERLWDEAETMRAQFVRGKPSPAVETMQRIVRGVVMKNWPDLAPKLKVFVIDNADVLAFSSANGDIFLSTGMLMRLDSEDELQVILARELAHVTHRHAVRSVYFARMAAGAKTVFELATDAADLASTVSGVAGVADLAKVGVQMFKVSPEMLLSTGKSMLQDQINKLKENLADSLLRSVSSTGFSAVVKSSLFGYSESLESEADEYAMGYIEDKFGSSDLYRQVMQRLLDEAMLDEKKFSAFYASGERLYSRLKRVSAFDEGKAARLEARRASAAAALAATSPAAVPQPPVAVPSVAVAAAPEAKAPVTPVVQLAPDAVVLDAAPMVAAVVVDDVPAGEGSTAAQPTAQPVVANAEPATASAAVIKTAALGVKQDSPLQYSTALQPLALPVLEVELESGRLGRLSYNIERKREATQLPEQVKELLAEGYASMADPAKVAKGEALAKEILAAKPDDARMLKLMGLMALKRGQAAQAKELLSKAREHVSTDDERGFLDQYIRQADKKLSAL